MRIATCLLLIATVTLAEDLPITRLAGVTFKVADLEKTRQFYTGMLGLEEAFDLKDSSGSIQSVFFKVNDDQYLEFSPGAAESFSMEYISMLTPDLKAGTVARSGDGNTYFSIKEPGQTEIRIVRYMPGSKQTELRGKALGA